MIKIMIIRKKTFTLHDNLSVWHFMRSLFENL